MLVTIKLTEPGELFRLPRDIIFNTWDFSRDKPLAHTEIVTYKNNNYYYIHRCSCGYCPNGFEEFVSIMKDRLSGHKYLTFFGPSNNIDLAAFPIATDIWYPYFDNYKNNC